MTIHYILIVYMTSSTLNCYCVPIKPPQVLLWSMLLVDGAAVMSFVSAHVPCN